jgi:hypothetical protein
MAVAVAVKIVIVVLLVGRRAVRVCFKGQAVMPRPLIKVTQVVALVSVVVAVAALVRSETITLR